MSPGVPAHGPRVRLASCRRVLEGSEDAPDDAALLAVLGERGVDADAAAWNDPSVRWGEAGLVVIRSTWDYHHAREAFVAWCEHVEATTALSNPAATVRANTDKHYLLDLAAAGVPTVPTHVVEPGQTPTVPAALTGQELVVKPAVSAGGHHTARYDPGAHEAATAHVARLLDAGHTALAQPYQHAVDQSGEVALVFIDGAFSHAVHKGPRLRAGHGSDEPQLAPERIAPRRPSSAERQVADQALAAARATRMLYARVDLLDDPETGPRLLELELTEPSLFLAHAEGAAARLAGAILARLPQ